ncbi:hypothetical protein ACFLRP_02310 [Bacteroidota bacterium]
MTEGMALRDNRQAGHIVEESQRRVSLLIAKEVAQAVKGAREAVIREAKSEAVGIIAEARRKADEIIQEAREGAEQVRADVRQKLQVELDRASQRRAMSAVPPRGVPPPFVDAEANRDHHGRMPVFWA